MTLALCCWDMEWQRKHARQIKRNNNNNNNKNNNLNILNNNNAGLEKKKNTYKSLAFGFNFTKALPALLQRGALDVVDLILCRHARLLHSLCAAAEHLLIVRVQHTRRPALHVAQQRNQPLPARLERHCVNVVERARDGIVLARVAAAAATALQWRPFWNKKKGGKERGKEDIRGEGKRGNGTC